ncbi:Gfo/Idh/MocA family oxidoreductase [Cyanobium sp. HWJ4-Hawea]|uniref:Gfo/Idh/MocA family protein n=1 Tax=unclassified Cyanobium TaxID=2627006 RepID=UPI0020CD1F21|nr:MULTISPECIES: Gfo/Idh/MocA family oxidoreductase [unclassified Cyanobium]MCP9774874.1 Gfo/Idh/MocA family oxidoreductase [Cyanobium sp. WAJ14-Wanaka]MCP9808965.1 Gfo/Idh/MocA family oxidoreductase [Cyanobium sp. HWJ4-Hawea]
MPLRVGLAGLGRFGQLHANVLASLADVQLAAVADPDPVCLALVADRYQVPACHTDAMALIEDDTLDAVILATPDGQHGEQARFALVRRRHLFVEKPLAPSWLEAKELQELAVRSGLVLQTGLLLRYEPSHRLLQRRVSAGEFGDLVSIRAKRNCSRSSFAAIADRIHTAHRTLIHDIDLVLWLSQSRITSVMALDYRDGNHLAPQGCFVLLRLADGSVAQLESSWYLPDPVDGTTSHRNTPHGNTSHGGIDAELALWPVIGGRVGGALRDQLADFCACVRNGRPSPVADLDTAVEALRIAEAVIEAGRSGGVVVLGPQGG